MATKHTPGPWHMSDQTERDGLPSVLIHGMPEGMLAIVRVGHQGRYYGDANARLIAAAPDLLVALQDLQAFVAVMVGRGADCVIPETIETPIGVPVKIGGIMRDAAAAIAKAEAQS